MGPMGLGPQPSIVDVVIFYFILLGGVWLPSVKSHSSDMQLYYYYYYVKRIKRKLAVSTPLEHGTQYLL